MKRTLVLLLATYASAVPLNQDQSHTPMPGESELYNTYRGKAPPFPGSRTQPILPTSTNKPAPDDNLWQNLLAAEWIIYSFYQQGVERFNTSSFTAAGLPNNTYDRIAEIRDNEAGHLETFYNAISDAGTKPAQCKYDYGFTTVQEFLGLQLLVEIGSMVFATGLVQQANLDTTRADLVSIGESETRHTVWALTDIWKQNPFGGPVETTYPYANQILYLTKQFVVPGSCPHGNLAFPLPEQELPILDFNRTSSEGHPGDEIEFSFSGPKPDFRKGKDYYAVYFHGLENVTVPYDHVKGTSRIPKQFEVGKGVILVSIADKPGASTAESVIAGPLILLQQPGYLTQSV